jgi:hypothetical protein
LLKAKEIKESYLKEQHYKSIIFKNGYLYVGGKTISTFNSKRAIVAKYDKNLNLDTNFASSGYAYFGVNHSINTLAIANNKIYVGGQEIVNYKAILHRLNLSGNTDISYGNSSGIVSNTTGTLVNKIIPLNDGKIYTAIRKIGNSVSIYRYLNSGVRDNTYGIFALIDISDMILKDNYFYLVGNTHAGGQYYGKVRRVNSNTGQVDSSFGNSGEVKINEGIWCRAQALSFDSDDNLYVSYNIVENSVHRFKLIKYDINGDIDTSFANSGKVEISDFNPLNSHIDSDGNLIIVGNKKVGSGKYVIKLAKIHL